MDIIKFEKKPRPKDVFDYQAVRDSIMGDLDGLNIEASVRHVSSEYLGADEDTINRAVATIRNHLKSILSDDDCARHFHETLLELEAICVNNTAGGSMGFGSCCIPFIVNETGIVMEIHILQTGFVRFIKGIRLVPAEV